MPRISIAPHIKPEPFTQEQLLLFKEEFDLCQGNMTEFLLSKHALKSNEHGSLSVVMMPLDVYCRMAASEYQFKLTGISHQLPKKLWEDLLLAYEHSNLNR